MYIRIASTKLVLVSNPVISLRFEELPLIRVTSIILNIITHVGLITQFRGSNQYFIQHEYGLCMDSNNLVLLVCTHVIRPYEYQLEY